MKQDEKKQLRSKFNAVPEDFVFLDEDKEDSSE